MVGYLSLAASSYDSHFPILHLRVICGNCQVSVQKQQGARVPSRQLESPHIGLTFLLGAAGKTSSSNSSSLQFAHRLVWG